MQQHVPKEWDFSWKRHFIRKGDGNGGYLCREAQLRFAPRQRGNRVIAFGLAAMDNGEVAMIGTYRDSDTDTVWAGNQEHTIISVSEDRGVTWGEYRGFEDCSGRPMMLTYLGNGVRSYIGQWEDNSYRYLVVLDVLGAKVLLKTAYNPYLKENMKLLSATDFIAELTLQLPPKGARYIRYYGLYSSRVRGKWQQWDHVAIHAPQGWQRTIGSSPDTSPHPGEPPQSILARQASSTWARLIKQVYQVDPLVCPRCGSEMKVIALILDPSEIRRILRHLVKIGRAPPEFQASSLN